MNKRNVRAPQRLARVQNLVAQDKAGVSKRDAVAQLRKYTIFQRLKINQNSTDGYNFGIGNFEINGNIDPFKEIIQNAALLWEQYRIRRISVRAQIGSGHTNVSRLKTILMARVDTDQENTPNTVAGVQSVLGSENTVLKTFTEKGNIQLCNYRPIASNRSATHDRMELPNYLQWYRTSNVTQHVWHGAVVGAMIPETTTLNLEVTLWFNVEVEFRGRVTSADVYNNTTNISTPVFSTLNSKDEE